MHRDVRWYTFCNMTELSFRFSMARTRQRARKHTDDEEDTECCICEKCGDQHALSDDDSSSPEKEQDRKVPASKRKQISPPETAADSTNRVVERLEHKQDLAGLELQVQESQWILAESKEAVQQKVLEEKILETENGTMSKTMINRTVQMIRYDKRILSAKLDVERAEIIKRRAQKTVLCLQLEKDIYEVNSGSSSNGNSTSSTSAQRN